MRSPLRWVGGKSQMAARIIQLLPKHVSYVEPCAGGAWVIFSKPKSKAEVLNDVDGELVNFYRVLKTQGLRLFREVDSYPYSRAVFAKMLRSRPTSVFARAVRFFYINRVCFAGKMEGSTYGYYLTRPCVVIPNWLQKDPQPLIDRMRGVNLEHLDAADILQRYDRPGTVFMIDPPYVGTEQPYAGRFTIGNYARLIEIMRSLKGKFLLTCNDRPDIRDLCRGFSIRKVQTVYSLGATTRPASEIIVSNYDLPREIDKSERRSRPLTPKRNP